MNIYKLEDVDQVITDSTTSKMLSEDLDLG